MKAREVWEGDFYCAGPGDDHSKCYGIVAVLHQYGHVYLTVEFHHSEKRGDVGPLPLDYELDLWRPDREDPAIARQRNNESLLELVGARFAAGDDLQMYGRSVCAVLGHDPDRPAYFSEAQVALVHGSLLVESVFRDACEKLDQDPTETWRNTIMKLQQG